MFFDDDLADEFMFFDEFIATDMPCPTCGVVQNLDVEDDQTDAHYRCSACNRLFSVNWMTRTTRRVEE